MTDEENKKLCEGVKAARQAAADGEISLAAFLLECTVNELVAFVLDKDVSEIDAISGGPSKKLNDWQNNLDDPDASEAACQKLFGDQNG